MKKLFAIVAASVLLAACGRADVGYACLDEPIVIKKAPETTPDPEPEPVEPKDTTTVVIPGFKGAVVGGEFKRVTNEYWPSVKFVENDEGTQSHGGNLRPSALWDKSFNGKVFTLNDTEVEENRFLRVEKNSLSDAGLEIDSDTLRVGVEIGRPDAVFTNGITVPFDVERRYGWVVVEGKYEALDNGLSKYQYIITANSVGTDTVFTGDEVYLREEIQLHLQMQVTNNFYTDEDILNIFLDKKVELPEEEEPNQEPEPEPEPVVETPVVEEPEPEPEPTPKFDYEIDGMKSFIAWTMVMDGNDNFHDCLFFDCGDRWAAVVDEQQPIYFIKSCVRGEGYNSLNWDIQDGIWVPAHGYSTGKDTWNYDTVLANGTPIDRGSMATYACTRGNDNFYKDDNARSSWQVNANANTSEYNGRVVITITAHKYVINKDYQYSLIKK